MTDELISQLLDFGALGIFAGFLIWQHLGMQKRLDALVEGFQDQVKSLNDDYDSRIEAMRLRYDKVICDIRENCRENEQRLQDEVKQAQRDLLARERESLLSFKRDK